ncbi:hypothetical protein VNI00_012543 [Paramarasmius palmivorus]|uniref:RlpA-like protein double-psi beta-barrel domain-containing protein n=1 Tax=Paramarasmius palmivorus TaxID=297713 RepID=A0AAW0C3T0_9AGAR
MQLNNLLLPILFASIGLVNAINGDATWYQPGGNYGACGAKNQNSDLVVALPKGKYANGSNCRKHINVHYKNKVVDVTVADLCPGCGPNDIDLTEGAFRKLANLDVGRIKVNWDFKGGLQLLDEVEEDMPVDTKVTGDATWYQPNGGYGACGAPSKNSDLVVALPQGQYAGGKKCWKHLGVHYKDKYVDVTVVDLCPGCGPNDIDLSEGAFKKLASLGTGRIKVTWNVLGGIQLLDAVDYEEEASYDYEDEEEAYAVGFPSINAITGDATWYQPNGGYGACGAPSKNSDLVVALPQGQYANGSKCWKHLNVHYKNKVVDVTVVDLCPGCGPNDIDLSEGAFRKLAGLDVGRIKVTWEVKGGLRLIEQDRGY